VSEPVGIVKQLIELAQTPEQVKFLLNSDTTQLSVQMNELQRSYDRLKSDKQLQDAAHKSSIKTYERVIEVMLKSVSGKGSCYE